METKECSICYDAIGNKNSCVTECGHQFCFKCIATSMQYNNKCPCCRSNLVDVPDKEDLETSSIDIDSDEEYDLMSMNELETSSIDSAEEFARWMVDEFEPEMDEFETEYSDIDDEESSSMDSDEEMEVDVEDIAKKLQERNITFLDMVSLSLGRFSTNNENYTDEYITSIHNKVQYIVAELGNEKQEQNEMLNEDINSLSLELSSSPIQSKSVITTPPPTPIKSL